MTARTRRVVWGVFVLAIASFSAAPAYAADAGAASADVSRTSAMTSATTSAMMRAWNMPREASGHLAIDQLGQLDRLGADSPAVDGLDLSSTRVSPVVGSGRLPTSIPPTQAVAAQQSSVDGGSPMAPALAGAVVSSALLSGVYAWRRRYGRRYRAKHSERHV